MKFQIIADSASDLQNDYLSGHSVGFQVIPMTIRVGSQEFLDDETLQTEEMLRQLHSRREKSATACPPPEVFEQEFQKADYTFVVTLTQKLSGTFNSARVAAQNHPNVFVVDSKAVSGVEILLVDKLTELIEQGLSFEEICRKITEYRDQCSLYFILHKFDNLIANGRMSRVAGLVAKTLIIRPLCVAEDGEIKVLEKVVGVSRVYKKLLLKFAELTVPEERRVIISHCNAPDEAKEFQKALAETAKFKEIRILPMRGLCSYYALEKGMIFCVD